MERQRERREEEEEDFSLHKILKSRDFEKKTVILTMWTFGAFLLCCLMSCLMAGCKKTSRVREELILQQGETVQIDVPPRGVRASDNPLPTYEEAIEPPSYEEVKSGKSKYNHFWGENV